MSIVDAASSDGGTISGSDDGDDRSWITLYGGRGNGSRNGALEEPALKEDDVDIMPTNHSGYGDGDEKAERDLSPYSSRHNGADGAKKMTPFL